MRSLKNIRISSSDWIQDFRDESVNLGPMDPSLFTNNSSMSAMVDELAASPPPLNAALVSHYTHRSPSVSPQRPSKTIPSLKKSMIASPTVSTNEPKSSVSLKKLKKKSGKKRRKRMLDESCVVEPTDGDVLSGRGGFTNTHPGNIRFRKKALEFRPWYEESSKEKKQEIADLLVNFIKNKGNRFLGKGKDGLWYEVIGNGPHYKASQALRERIKNGDAK